MLDWLSGIAESIGNLANDITSGIGSFFTTSIENIGLFFESLGEKVTDYGEKLSSGLISVSDILSGLADNIVLGVGGLFIPSTDFFTDKIDMLVEKFAFVSSIVDTVDLLTDFLNDVGNGEVPRVEINLSLAESKYNYGTTAFALDMSWYSRYKPSVDSLLSSMMWLFFIWRIFCALPGIISGTSAMYGSEERYTKIMEKRSNGK